MIAELGREQCRKEKQDQQFVCEAYLRIEPHLSAAMFLEIGGKNYGNFFFLILFFEFLI